MDLEGLVGPSVYGQISSTGKRCHEIFRTTLKRICTVAISYLCIFHAEASSLIQPEQLKEKLDAGEPLLLLDVRPRVTYLLGHIPSAHNVWRPAYQANEGDYPVAGMRADKTKMEKLFGHFGARSETPVVLYDDYQCADAARLWWLLKLYGHDDVSILNGGLKKWSALGYKQALLPPANPKPTKYRFTGKAHSQYLANLSEVKQAVENKNVILLDVRTEDEYTGRKRKSGAHRAGHIPGSQWFDYRLTVNKDGFLDQSELLKLIADHNISADRPVITYCQSGVRSAQTLFVLTQLLGFDQVKNYDGSWIEWSWHHNLPLSKGSSP